MLAAWSASGGGFGRRCGHERELHVQAERLRTPIAWTSPGVPHPTAAAARTNLAASLRSKLPESRTDPSGTTTVRIDRNRGHSQDHEEGSP
jgi:hypothetical protein